MYSDEDDDKTVYDVVVNHEEQYSIWPADREMCPGWKAAGKTGLKPECLEYISDVWTDMRPLSLRKQMEEMEARRPEIEAEDARRIEEENAKPKDPRDDLVAFLSDGDHPVEIGLRPENSSEEFKAAVDRGYVHVKFTDTRGGSELGVRLDTDRSDFSEADLDRGVGRARVVGGLTLDYVPVRCVATIDIETLSGTGHLERVES
jgi:uncharacterized protein YbdZ (MbtH family)